MIDILQLVPLRPEVQKELEARYRVHGRQDFDHVAGIVRGCVTNGHSGPPPEMIDRMPKLEIIASASVGYDGIPVEYARSKGIPVCNTPEVLNDDVADLAIALMIMTARNLVTTDRYVRSGGWAKNGEHPLAHRASGKRVGILGMGRIGKEIAKRAEAMNNSVAYHSRRPTDVPYKYYADLVELAKNS
ncbi:MAG TPA: NAD(P)-dependent oxidoreductase, partial [Rhizomicrobium sp.]